MDDSILKGCIKNSIRISNGVKNLAGPSKSAYLRTIEIAQPIQS